jgi:uncharacterized protein YpuA (DUF1002 family)
MGENIMEFDDDRNMSEDELEAIKKLVEGEGYEAMMESVNDVRSKTYKLFYAWYGNKSGKTKHEINEILVEKGIKDYNDTVNPDTKCETIEEVMKDFKEEVNLTFIDTLASMQDRGMMVMIKEKLGITNAHGFLEKMGVDIDED